MAAAANPQFLRLVGIKRGMVQLFDEQGFVSICTVIEVEPHHITQIKTKERDGYNALQLASGMIQTKDPRTLERRVSKPLRHHFQKAGVAPSRYLFEARIDDLDSYQIGQQLSLTLFDGIDYVDVSGKTIGKGFQGVMKKYGFGGGRASHGTSKYHRGIGSTGMRSTPGRCLPGGKRASHMGNQRKTVENIPLFTVNAEKNLLIVKGQVPGPKGGAVWIRPALKKQLKKN